MAWWMAAAALAPVIAGAVTPRPKTPTHPGRQDLGRRDDIADLIALSRDPQSDVWQRAQEQAMANIDRGLARRGLTTSSMGMQQHRTAGAEIANKFLENELARRQRALQTAMAYDQAEMGLGDRAYKADMMRYKDEMDAASGLIKGIGAAAGVGSELYSQGLTRDAYGILQDQLRRDSDERKIYFGTPDKELSASYDPFDTRGRTA